MSSWGPIGILNVGQIAIITHNLERAVAFYRDVLELPLLYWVSSLAFFDCGGVRIMLSTPDTEDLDHPASIIYYRVTDIHTAYGTLYARGVYFIDKPHLVARLPDHEVWMAFFYDPDGNTLALMAEVPLPGR